jgi:hypothetical protein
VQRVERGRDDPSIHPWGLDGSTTKRSAGPAILYS